MVIIEDIIDRTIFFHPSIATHRSMGSSTILMFQNLIIVKWCGWNLGSQSSANLLLFVTILDSRAFLLFVTILDSRPILLFVDDGLAKT